MRYLLLTFVVLSLTGCPGGVMNAAAKRVAEGLTRGVLNHNDVTTVREGLPTYLLVVDGLIEAHPDNVDMLLAGARLYSLYSTSFAGDPARAKRLAARGREYAQRLFCLELDDLCAVQNEPFEVFKKELALTTDDEVAVLYTFGSAWASWIQANSGDWNAIAELPKVQAIMEQVVKIDPGHEHGNAHLYLGVLATQLPPDLGGRAEEGRAHFEMAIKLEERNLIAKVLFARQYARLVFDRELHDRLLNEVMSAPAEVDGLTLSNTLAKQEAQRLLAGADEYF